MQEAKKLVAIAAVAAAALQCVAAAPHAGILKSTAEIEAVPGTEASQNRPFDIRATVATPNCASLASISTFIVFDETGGALLQNHVANSNVVIRAGDRIHATGGIDVYAGSTFANCYTLAVESHGPAPQPVKASVRELLAGRHDYRLTTISGIVRDVFLDEVDTAYIYLVLDCDGETMYAPLRRDRHEKFASDDVIGAEVAITGRCFAHYAGWRRKIGRIFREDYAGSVKMLKPPACELFDAPPLEDCKLMRPSEIMALGRRRVTGTVIAVWHGSFLLKTSKDTVSRVDFAGTSAPPNGAHVEVAGFPESDLYHINFTRARWRQIDDRTDEPAPARDVSIKTLLYGQGGPSYLPADFHGKAMRIRGVVKSLPESARPEKILYVEDGGYMIPVNFDLHPSAGERLAKECEVEISGVCVMGSENWRQNSVFPQIKDVFLVIRGPDDVRIISYPPWWTPRRLMVVIAAMLALVLAVIAWNTSLRTLAERRGRELTKETISHVESELKVSERTRLAVELHDTLAQYLTGAIMEIRTGSRICGELPPAAQEHFALTQKTLESCRQELRNCLWDLRNKALEQPCMDAAIRQTLAPYAKKAELAVRFNVPREMISDNTAHAILRIVRELVVNAIRHGHSTSIKVAGSVENGQLLFSVKDNGVGFVAEKAPGIEDGHFGLQGIRERIAQFNGELRIESILGKGTDATVCLTLPSAHHAPVDE